MAQNRVQFQQGLSLPTFMARYVTEAQCETALEQVRWPDGFLKKLIERAPFHVMHVVTDNGKEFTDRFAATGEREPTGRHPFDRLCASTRGRICKTPSGTTSACTTIRSDKDAGAPNAGGDTQGMATGTSRLISQTCI